MVLIGWRLANSPLPLKAMVAATEGLIHARESLPRLTAWSSRNPSAAKEKETPFSRVAVSARVSE